MSLELRVRKNLDCAKKLCKANDVAIKFEKVNVASETDPANFNKGPKAGTKKTEPLGLSFLAALGLDVATVVMYHK